MVIPFQYVIGLRLSAATQFDKADGLNSAQPYHLPCQRKVNNGYSSQQCYYISRPPCYSDHSPSNVLALIMLLTSGQISVAISSSVGKLPSSPRLNPKQIASLTNGTYSLRLHYPPLPLRLHTATTNRALLTACPTPPSLDPDSRRESRSAKTFRPTARPRGIL